MSKESTGEWPKKVSHWETSDGSGFDSTTEGLRKAKAHQKELDEIAAIKAREEAWTVWLNDQLDPDYKRAASADVTARYASALAMTSHSKIRNMLKPEESREKLTGCL
jgi:hypothetical protein